MFKHLEHAVHVFALIQNYHCYFCLSWSLGYMTSPATLALIPQSFFSSFRTKLLYPSKKRNSNHKNPTVLEIGAAGHSCSFVSTGLQAPLKILDLCLTPSLCSVYSDHCTSSPLFPSTWCEIQKHQKDTVKRAPLQQIGKHGPPSFVAAPMVV